MSNGLDDALDRLPAVDLASVDRAAGLLSRRDRKYIVPTGEALALVQNLAATAAALTISGRRVFCYESVYFDTGDLDTYLAAARGRPRRFKIRTRAYLDSGQLMLEIKRRDRRGRTAKVRTEHLASSSDQLDERGISFLADQAIDANTAHDLAPVLRTTYRRATLLLAEGQRLTIDADLRSINRDGRSVRLPGMAIIETKSIRSATMADHLLWESGHRPVRISKFCTSLAALEPALPSNRWGRALSRPWMVDPEVG